MADAPLQLRAQMSAAAAKSSWKQPELDDLERPLNRRGERDVPLMGARLALRGLRPELILSSPARRARATAAARADQLGLAPVQVRVETSLYPASPADQLRLIPSQQGGLRHVLLVGHNPGLLELGQLLVPAAPDRWPTWAVLALAFEVDSWRRLAPGGGRLVWYDFPKNPGAASF